MKTKFLTFLLLSSFVFTQGEAAVPFLLISPDAHSSALGESGVTFPETPGLAMHYNVAGLAYQHIYGDSYGNNTATPVNFSYADWLPNLKLNDLWYLHSAVKFNWEGYGIFGFSVRYLNLGTVIVTAEDGPEKVDEYEANEFELNLAYSFDIDDSQFFGVGLKYIHSGIIRSDVVVGSEGETEPTSPGSSVAVDLGYYAMLGDWSDYTKDVRFGMSWNNIGPSITYRDNAQSDPLPIILRAGLSTLLMDDEFSKLRINYEMGLLTLEQTLKSINGSNFLERITHSTGLEFTYDNTFILRGGGFFETDRSGGRRFATVGLGFNAASMVVDASYLISLSDDKHPLDGTTRFSLRFNL
jgi:hypothetical protein